VADPVISTNAITGIQTSSMLQLATVVHAVGLTSLVDSGSTHSFVDAAVAARVGLVFEPCASLSVGVSNGDRVPCAGICQSVAIFIDHEEFTVDLFVIQLGGFDIVLGCEWLRTLGPILWDLNVLSMEFWRHDHRVQWFGVNARPSSRLSALATDAFLSLLLEEFQDLFSTPSRLPPPRAFDHRIHLLPGSLPVAVRPYRYPQLLKDEIEAQCAAMLEQGIIRASTSSFSSPGLLVRKPDESWRFCVEYRALNMNTVRDKFPIPMVDEPWMN
jgi:hypothetical protein